MKAHNSQSEEIRRVGLPHAVGFAALCLLVLSFLIHLI